MRTTRAIARGLTHAVTAARAPIANRYPSRHARLVCVVALLLPVMAAACGRSGETDRIPRAVIVAGNGFLPPTLYLTARNVSPVADTIVGAAVEGAASATFVRHRDHLFDANEPDTSADAAQVRVARIPIDAGGVVELTHEGTYVIITPGTRPLVVGDSARVTLRFAHAPPADRVARVVEYAQLDSALSTAVASGFPRWFVQLFNATPGAPDSVRNPTPTVETGRDLYASNGCISCHGLNGYGDGPVGATLNPPPRDFRAAGAFRTGLDERAIAQTLATGIPNGGSMPRYPHLSEPQRRSIALYVLSLARPSATSTTLP